MSLLLVLGNVGTGKTTLGRAAIYPYPNRLIVDPMSEHDGDFVCESLSDCLDLFSQQQPPTGTVVVRHFNDAECYHDQLFSFMGNLHGWALMVDEADEYCSPHGIVSEFRRLVNYRRHFGIPRIVAVARRPSAIHRDLSALADTFYLLRTHETRDLEYIARCCGQEYADQCRNLPNFKYLEVNFPAKITLDAS